jgi:glycosidase
VQEYNIDGFRCDVAGMVPTEFWNQAREELDQIKPLFMLAEWETPEMHEEAFDMTYSWDLYKIFNSIVKKEKNAEDVVKYFTVEKSLYPKNAFRMRFTSNHDENTWNGTEFERLGDAVETFAVLTAVIPGMPLLYNGQEAGLNKRLQFFEKDPIEWKEHKFAGIYSKLFNWKMQSSVLQNGERGAELEIINSSDTENILAFVRRNDEEKILAVFNLSDKAQSFALNDKLIKGIYRNFFSGEETTFNEKESIMLDDWGYKIFIRK